MNNGKYTLSLFLLIVVMSVFFALPGFAETYDELKEKFVTREEWDAWINGSGTSTGISQAIKDLEINMQVEVQNKTKQAMLDRNMKLPEA